MAICKHNSQVRLGIIQVVFGRREERLVDPVLVRAVDGVGVDAGHVRGEILGGDQGRPRPLALREKGEEEERKEKKVELTYGHRITFTYTD